MYSQAWQDEFVDLVLDHPTTGFFVDVGAGYDEVVDGKINSNSLMFEQRGWDGICIDGDIKRMKGRKNPIEAFLNSEMTLGSVLQKAKCPSLVSYLSIDIEGADFEALKSFVESGYVCKVLTIEHNLYTQNPGVQEDKFRIFDYLSKHGYIRVVDNAGTEATIKDLRAGGAFEDWYINPVHVGYQTTMKKLAELKS